MKKTNLTFDEALHLVKRHLGLAHSLTRSGGWWHVFDRTKLKASGRSLLEAVEAAGIEVPEEDDGKAEFVAIGAKVMYGPDQICGARSATFARRIANALNVYKPDRRGQ